MNICHTEILPQGGVITTLFLAGLAGSLTHCTGMCGPFVLQQVNESPKTNPSILRRLRGALLLPYHFGRMTTYMVLAVFAYFFAGWLGSAMNTDVRIFLLLAAAMLFLLQVIDPKSIWLPMPNFIKWLPQSFSYLLRNPSGIKGYPLGVLLGFLPCGLIMAALPVAATASDAGGAALAMGAFAVGTIPSLFMVALTGQFAVKQLGAYRLPAMRTIAVLNALVLFYFAGASLI